MVQRKRVYCYDLRCNITHLYSIFKVKLRGNIRAGDPCTSLLLLLEGGMLKIKDALGVDPQSPNADGPWERLPRFRHELVQRTCT